MLSLLKIKLLPGNIIKTEAYYYKIIAVEETCTLECIGIEEDYGFRKLEPFIMYNIGWTEEAIKDCEVIDPKTIDCV